MIRRIIFKLSQKTNQHPPAESEPIITPAEPLLHPTVVAEQQEGIFTAPFEHWLRTEMANKHGLLFSGSYINTHFFDVITGETRPYISKSGNTYSPISRVRFYKPPSEPTPLVHEQGVDGLITQETQHYALLPRSEAGYQVWKQGVDYAGDIINNHLSGISAVFAMDTPSEAVSDVLIGSIRSLPEGGVVNWQRNTGTCDDDIKIALNLGLIPIEYAVDSNGVIFSVIFAKQTHVEELVILPDFENQMEEFELSLRRFFDLDDKFDAVTYQSTFNQRDLHFRALTSEGNFVLHLEISDLAMTRPVSPQNFIPVIRDFKVPDRLKRKGYGSRLVATLEELSKGFGYRMIVAQNLTDEGIEFWPRKGFVNGENTFITTNPREVFYKTI